MDWRTMFRTFREALILTFEAVGLAQKPIRDHFDLGAKKILALCGASSRQGWPHTFDELEFRITQRLSVLAKDQPEKARAIHKAIDELLKSTAERARAIAGPRWFHISEPWILALRMSADIFKASRISLGPLSVEALHWASGFEGTPEADLKLISDLSRQMRTRNQPLDDELLSTAQRVFAERCFITRLRRLLDSEPVLKSQICERLSRKAQRGHESKQSNILATIISTLDLPFEPDHVFEDFIEEDVIDPLPTLIIGLECLLDKGYAEEILAKLENDPRAVEAGIPEILALWFGELAVEFLQSAVMPPPASADTNLSTLSSISSRLNCIAALGSIGGFNASRALGGVFIYLPEIELREKALSMIEQLAVPTAIASCGEMIEVESGRIHPRSRTEFRFRESEDEWGERIFGYLLDNFATLKQLGTFDPQRLMEVEERVKACQYPI